MRSWSIAGFGLAMSLPLRSPATGSALPLRDQRGQPIDGERIAGNAEAAQARLGYRGDMGEVAKAFAREDVADVHFDDRQLDRGDGVAESHRGVGIGAGIDDHAGSLLGGGFVD